ncbi:MAG: hypothetical protein GY805_12905, partial [Chloroflexi bacterium]|nr:hypothetical protein [Chloroflexota bacterium]
MTQKIRLLTTTGTPHDIGYQHGIAYRDTIHHYTAERMELVCSGIWSGHKLPPADVLSLADACLPAHKAYAPKLYQELEGLAEATNLSLGELIVVGGFTDFIDTVYNSHRSKDEQPSRLPVDDCTAFIIPDDIADGAGYFGQTWDMHDTANEFVILLNLQPSDSPHALIFTTTGCLGQFGMNEHGICVGINNIMGADGQIGVTWPFVVRKVLQQDNIEAALACITEAKLAGAHNYLLFDKLGNGYNVEAMSTHHVITTLSEEPLIHTNHCLLPETNQLAQQRPLESQISTEARYTKATELLQKRPLTIQDLIAITR